MSQNKRILSNVDEVLVTFVDESKCFISGFWGTGSDTLGIYSSREKALKVLNEILLCYGEETVGEYESDTDNLYNAFDSLKKLASKETPKKPIDVEFGPCGESDAMLSNLQAWSCSYSHVSRK